MALSKEIFEIGKKFSFGREMTGKLLLEVDQLTLDELSDLEYVEDRLDTHSGMFTDDGEWEKEMGR